MDKEGAGSLFFADVVECWKMRERSGELEEAVDEILEKRTGRGSKQESTVSGFRGLLISLLSGSPPWLDHDWLEERNA